MQTAAELAAKLNGVEHLRLPEDLVSEAKASGLVVVYSARADIMTFEGAIRASASVFDGAYVQLNQTGLLTDVETGDYEDDAEAPSAPGIKVSWISAGAGMEWACETDIPHALFEVTEDGEFCCRGLVFALADLPSA